VVKSFDDSETRKVPGVKRVFKVKMDVFNTTREGIAVIADSTWAAMQGRKVLKVEWDDSGFEHINSTDIRKRQEELLNTRDGIVFSTQGDPKTVIDQAAKKLDVIYQTPYEAHYCMEPLNCVAHYQKDKLEVWGPIQAPDWVQDYLSKKFDLPKEKTIVNMTFLGGGFGRKAFLDYPHEAVVISKELGAPVQVVWTGKMMPRKDHIAQACLTGVVVWLRMVRSAPFNLKWQGRILGTGMMVQIKPNPTTASMKDS
jgi:isoquinoline 1-oxidoreductase beta subunit